MRLRRHDRSLDRKQLADRLVAIAEARVARRADDIGERVQDRARDSARQQPPSQDDMLFLDRRTRCSTERSRKLKVSNFVRASSRVSETALWSAESKEGPWLGRRSPELPREVSRSNMVASGQGKCLIHPPC